MYHYFLTRNSIIPCLCHECNNFQRIHKNYCTAYTDVLLYMCAIDDTELKHGRTGV